MNLRNLFSRKKQEEQEEQVIFNGHATELLKTFSEGSDRQWHILIPQKKLTEVGKRKALYHLNGNLRSSLAKLRLPNVKIQQMKNELYLVKV